MAGKNTEYELAIKIAGKLDKSLGTSISNANKQLSQIQTTSQRVGSIASKAMTSIGIAAAAAFAAGAAAAAKFTVDSVKAAAAYEKQMKNVSTLLFGTEDEVSARIGELSEDIIDVSNRTGKSTSDLADGMYEVISAFEDSADAVETLEIAAKAAVAGNATTQESINMLAVVTKGYGDVSAEAQQKVVDFAFQTANLGQTTFPELAESMGRVIPLAVTMGVKQEELFGAMATLTGVTGNTAEVTTQLRGTIAGLLQPTDKMAAKIKKLGYSDGQVMIKTLGLQGTLDKLKDSVNDNDLAFAELFGRVEAKNAVLALAGEQAEDFTKKTKAMYEAAGVAETAFKRQADSLDYTVSSLKNLGTNFKTEFGMALLPPLKEAAEKLLPALTDKLNEAAPMLDGMFDNIDVDSLADAVVDTVPVLIDFITNTLPLVPQAIQDTISLAQTLLPILRGVMDILVPLIGYTNIGSNLLTGDWKGAQAAADNLRDYKNERNGTNDYIDAMTSSGAAQAITNMIGSGFGAITGTGENLYQNADGTYNFGVGVNGPIDTPSPTKDYDITGWGGSFATGGIAMTDMLARVGDGGEPEAIIPLSKINEVLATASGDSFTGGSVTFAPNIVINGNADGEAVKEAVGISFEEFERLYARLQREKRRTAF